MNFNDPLQIRSLHRAVGSLGAFPCGIAPMNRTMGVGQSVEDLLLVSRLPNSQINRHRGGNHGAYTIMDRMGNSSTTLPSPVIARGANLTSNVQSVSGALEDFLGGIGDLFRGVVIGQAQRIKVEALKVLGYRPAPTPVVNLDGKSYVVLIPPQGGLRKVGPDGEESDYLPTEQGRASTMSTTGSWASPTNIALAAAAVVGLFLILRRR